MQINIKIVTPLLITLLSLFLISCGGGSFTVADGGISGTGITMGRITNFGSIFVNGVRFDVDNASFLRDGNPSTGQAEFSVGEYVVLKGTIDANGTSGTATEVSFTDALEGVVTLASTNNLTIEILGQSVKTDPLTVFIGFNLLSSLTVGNIVEVSGVKDANDVITATSIKLKENSFVVGVSENELKGTISNIDLTAQTFDIGNITIEYGGAALQGFNGQSPQNGQFVEAKSDSNISGTTLVADKVELEDEFQNLSANTEAEIEGLVTRFVSSTDFDVNGLASTTTASTEYDNGTEADITLGSFIEVEGTVNASGVLVAEEISFEKAESDIELSGLLQSINVATNEIELLNQVVVVDASTLMIDDSDQSVSPLTLNDLVIGDNIKVHGIALANGKILATKLEREEEDDDDDD